MKIFVAVVMTTALLVNQVTVAFSVDSLSRRDAFQAAFASATAAVGVVGISVLPANAMPTEETPRTITRMGGLLVGGLGGDVVMQCRRIGRNNNVNGPHVTSRISHLW
jgi:hypothetical protein